MAKKNKKAKWKKLHEVKLKQEREGKITQAKMRAKREKRGQKVVVKGKNLKRLGIIPKDERLKRFRPDDLQLTMDCEEVIRPQKRRKRFETREEVAAAEAAEAANPAAAAASSSSSDAKVEATPEGMTVTKQVSASEQWVNKTKKYDWASNPKFSGFRSKQWKKEKGFAKQGFAAQDFEKAEYTFL